MKTPIYLDYAAATPVDDAALQAMQPYHQSNFFNASAVYQAAREVRKDLERARGVVASVLGAKDQEIIFTSGGTEANNLAIHGVMLGVKNGNIVVSSIEHESVLEPANQYECRVVPVSKRGIVIVDELEKLIDENTVLVSVMYANNEIGTIQPIKEIANLIAKKRVARNNTPLYLHVDACQAANYLDIQVTRLGVDLLTLNGGKIYAPKQSGALYVKTGVHLTPLIYGGGQERTLRSGTENVGSQIAFATMLQKVQSMRKAESYRVEKMRDEIFAKLSQRLPFIKLNGDVDKRVANNLNICISGVDGERLLMELDEHGLMVATGSACTASSDEPSHVLLAIGLDTKQASSSIRLTLGRGVHIDQVPLIVEGFVQVIQTHLKLV